ncbi:MAG TPA: MetQ/NlpA family ABC transporter substrate-binding protein [Clostridiales bacterium]|nr:MetQ/NlpA family ABC transporter substrate-binding protein [Clostridiales bacterium]
MKKLKILLLTLLAGVLTFGLVACKSDSKVSSDTNDGKNNSEEVVTKNHDVTEDGSADEVTIKLGVVGENNEQWEPVIAKLAEEGINLVLVKFADYSLPNQALADGEIELNAFQHYAYLNNEIKDKGLQLTVIGETIIAPLGLYSDKVKSISEITEAATIAIPSDATNGGRALKLLESAGLIKVDPEAGYVPTVSDITDNPLKIEFYEVEAANTPSLLADVTAAIINGGHAVDNGLYPQKDSIYLEEVSENSDNPYINIIVARTDEIDNENYKKLVEAYRSEEVAKVIEEVYKGGYIPTWN